MKVDEPEKVPEKVPGKVFDAALKFAGNANYQ
jgi:hypothetical protein